MGGDAGSLIPQDDETSARSTCFNADDPYWQLYKSQNSGPALIDLEEQISEFQEDQAEFKRLQGKLNRKEATENDLLSIVRESGQI